MLQIMLTLTAFMVLVIPMGCLLYTSDAADE